MEDFYSLNQLATITGLTTRTLRNYIKMDILKGERINGIWQFSADDIGEFIGNPYVKASIGAKRRAIVLDFLAEDKKKENEMCTIIDAHASEEEAKEIADFFCSEINKRSGERIEMGIEVENSRIRIILRGYEDTVMEILDAYYERK